MTRAGTAAADRELSSGATSEWGVRVLVVDDNEAVRRLFRMILTSGLTGCEVDVARDGAEAVELFARHRHRVLVMDLHMPVMDGEAAYHQIRRLCEERRWPMPAVVFCTGYAPPDTVQTIVAADHRHALLAKPVTADTVIHAVRNRLGAPGAYGPADSSDGG